LNINAHHCAPIPFSGGKTKVGEEIRVIRLVNAYFRLLSFVVICYRIGVNRCMLSSNERTCEECGGLVKGRLGKRFCSDYCRNTHNNRLNSDVTLHIRNTNNTLRRNRRILMALNPAGKTRVTKEKLLLHGFDFALHTGQYTTKDGATYFYCYEQGYLPLEKDYFLLVRKDLKSP
jgi:hypothetical protein